MADVVASTFITLNIARVARGSTWRRWRVTYTAHVDDDAVSERAPTADMTAPKIAQYRGVMGCSRPSCSEGEAGGARLREACLQEETNHASEVTVQAGTCPMKYMPNAQKAADMTVPKTANIVMVLENGCENSMCRHEQT